MDSSGLNPFIVISLTRKRTFVPFPIGGNLDGRIALSKIPSLLSAIISLLTIWRLE